MVKWSIPLNLSQPYDTASLAGKSILITGGASGFGAGFARRWAQHGAHITIGDVDDAAAEELVAELRSQPGSSGRHHYQHCDVTRWEDQLALFQAAARTSPTGGIDAVVASAGVVEKQTFPGGSEVEDPVGLDLDALGSDASPPPPAFKCLAVNLMGTMYTAHLALYWLPRNSDSDPSRARDESSSGDGTDSTGRPRDRHLLLIGSIAGLTGIPGHPQYCTSKHAVAGLFRSLRLNPHPRGVRVNMLCPYFVNTSLLPQTGKLLLAGAALGTVESVVDAGTRLMADEGTVGRALVVGPGMDAVDGDDGEWVIGGDGKEITLDGGKDKRRDRAIWECYLEDFKKTEVFMRRYVGLLDIAAKVRGWTGFFKDIISVLWPFGGKTYRKR